MKNVNSNKAPLMINGEKVIAVYVYGKRWFQRSYGNTYHSVAVVAELADRYVDIGEASREYGYDRQFEVTAKDLLCKYFNFEDVGSQYIKAFCNDMQVACHVSVRDVKRERDL